MKSSGLSLISWTCVGMYLSDTLNADSSPDKFIIFYGPHSFTQGPVVLGSHVSILCSGVPNLFSSYCHLARHWKLVAWLV